MKSISMPTLLGFVLLLSLSPIFAKGPVNRDLAKPIITNDLITLQTSQDIDVQRFELVIAGPENTIIKHQFDGNHIPFIEIYDAEGNILPDGAYSYELRVVPQISAEGKAAIAAMRENGDYSNIEALRTSGVLPGRPEVQNGHFRVLNGYIVVPQAEESALTIETSTDGRNSGAQAGTATTVQETGGTSDTGQTDRDLGRDQVIADDLIVDGSACIGFDCVNGESFGFDTIRLKENNLRIKFEDTSTSASFPGGDWQLTANDSANGGANKFSIDDITGGRTPFTVEANAPSHSLYVDDGGRLGLGTSIPVADIHAVSGNSPTLRLEQNGSSGFAPQTWDVAGNETNFFVRDATNGSTLPLRIRPGAPSSAIFVDTDGDVGIGDASPDAKLDVESGTLQVSDGTILVNDTTTRTQNINPSLTEASLKLTHTASVSSDSHILMLLEANGSANFLFRDVSDGVIWKQIMNGGGGNASTFSISRDASGGNEFVLDHDGDLEIRGALTQGSDRNRKDNILAIDPTEVLAKVVSMPITTWSYDTDSSVTHMGPMAQDFYAAFGLGSTDKGIASVDSDGVALAAIQGLNKELQDKKAEIKELKAQLAAQEARLKAIEELLNK